MAGQVPSSASASSASFSLSANTGDASTIAGPSIPMSGTLLVATICSSTLRSTSALISRAQVNTSSAQSKG